MEEVIVALALTEVCVKATKKGKVRAEISTSLYVGRTEADVAL
jgi:hypothetical protein